MQNITKSTPQESVTELTPPCRCNKCNHGCTMGSGILAQDDIKIIASHLQITEQELKEKHLESLTVLNKQVWRPKLNRNGKPYGQCTFYKNKMCSIHKVKPLQCKIAMGCKPYGEDVIAWFMLNHILNPADPESIRQYDQYIKAGGKVIEGGKIEDIVPDKNKRDKILNYKIIR